MCDPAALMCVRAQILPLNGEIKAGIHGTVSHMPPEAMKETIFSLATDVFSFGVVLWEMVTQVRGALGPTCAHTHYRLW